MNHTCRGCHIVFNCSLPQDLCQSYLQSHDFKRSYHSSRRFYCPKCLIMKQIDENSLIARVKEDRENMLNRKLEYIFDNGFISHDCIRCDEEFTCKLKLRECQKQHKMNVKIEEDYVSFNFICPTCQTPIKKEKKHIICANSLN